MDAAKDNLDFLLSHGMGLDTIQEIMRNGASLHEIAASARRMVERGESIAGPKDDITPSFFADGKFLHNVMGDYLMQKYHACKINDTVHVYDAGVYKHGEEFVHGQMIELLPNISDARRREVYKYIKVNRNTPIKEVSPPYLIPFKSRIYNILTDEFAEYSPEYVFLNRFPYDYKPDAPDSPALLDTIYRIADDDAEVVKLIFEAMGNCFYLLNSFRGAVMLYGRNGNNGKSTLLNMITQLLGRENASYLSLQDTAERFRLMEVYGKAANIGDDIPDTYFPDSSIFKKLVTGEQVIAEKKGQDPVAFRPYAKLFFAMNGLPPVSDKSKAFFSRILLIPLNRDFSHGSAKDVSLKDRVWTAGEMECLTRYAVEGLKRLRQQGDFTKPECVVRALAEYEAENNSVLAFLSEYKNVVGEPTEKVYMDYQNWCERSGHKNTLSRYRFSREVCTQLGLATALKRNIFFGGEPGRCFTEP